MVMPRTGAELTVCVCVDEQTSKGYMGESICYILFYGYDHFIEGHPKAVY